MQFILAFALFGNIELSELEAPTIGIFYIPFWTLKDEKPQHWDTVKAWKHPFPLGGKYDCEDPKIIERQIKAMKDCGIQFIVFDDTNCVLVDNGQIDRRISTWFDWMDKQPEQERLGLVICPGGELNEHKNRESWSIAVNFLYDKYAGRPSYASLDGKPLLCWYIHEDVWPDWDDPRWTVRKTFIFPRAEDQRKDKGWGIGSRFPLPNKECMSIMPSWHNPGADPHDFVPKNNGEFYKRSWLEVLRYRPRYVLISSWNEYNEDRVIEANSVSRDQYTHLTKGYIAAARQKKVDGFTYEIEGERGSYLWSKDHWTRRDALRGAKRTIVVPKNHFTN